MILSSLGSCFQIRISPTRSKPLYGFVREEVNQKAWDEICPSNSNGRNLLPYPTNLSASVGFYFNLITASYLEELSKCSVNPLIAWKRVQIYHSEPEKLGYIWKCKVKFELSVHTSNVPSFLSHTGVSHRQLFLAKARQYESPPPLLRLRRLLHLYPQLFLTRWFSILSHADFPLSHPTTLAPNRPRCLRIEL